MSIKKNISALAIITMALALTSCQLTDFTKEDYVSGISVFRKTGQKTPKGSKSKKTSDISVFYREGGFRATYKIKGDVAPSQEKIEEMVEIINARLEKYGGTKKSSLIEVGDNMEISILFEWNRDDLELNPQSVASMLGETGLMTFRDNDDNILLDSSNIREAIAQQDEQGNVSLILEFDETGAEKLASVTRANIGRQIFVYMDDNLLWAPTVNEEISGGRAVITMDSNKEEAVQIANKINSQVLPFNIELESVHSIKLY